MDTLETLYFPDTVIATDAQSALFLFFNLVHVLQPVEIDEVDDPTIEPTDTFMDKGFCQVHTPAPLGANRDRFLHLVNDIKSRKDDYAAQLSSLAIASMSAPKNSSDEDSRHAIVSSLFGGPQDLAVKEDAAQQAELWQARLVLAIGEILDREEEEIADALSILEKSETDLFDRLLGKEEEVEELFTDLAQPREKVDLPRPGTIKNRLKAWSSLYRSDNLPGWWLWTTTRPEAADILLEMFEKKTGRTAIPFWQLELPAATGIELQDHMDKIEAFRLEAQSLTARIAEKFNSLARQELHSPPEPVTVLPESGSWGDEWAALLEAHFPAELYGRTPLCFHLLSDIQLSELAGAKSQSTETDNKVEHGILAVIG